MVKQSLLAILLCIISVSAYSQDNSTSKSRDDKWREDLAFIVEEMQKVHKDIFNRMSKSEMESFVADLNARIPSLSDNEIMVEFVRLGVMIGDGHTSIRPSDFKVFPVNMFIFDDGLYATASFEKYSDIVGKKVTKINGTNVEDVYRKVEPLVNRDNDITVKASMPFYMKIEGVLNGLGIIDGETAEFTYENENGSSNTLTMEPVLTKEFYYWYDTRKTDPPASMYLRNRDRNYWFEYLPDTKTLYFKYNVVREDEDESIGDFLHRMAEAIYKNPIDRFVIDLRYNGGGNLFTSKPFINFIKNNNKINQNGKLFTIINRHTFSAASYFTTALEYRTKTIFVGEPTGASPNHYGDHGRVVTPNYKMQGRFSTIYWENSFPFDDRPWTPPDIMTGLTYSDYITGNDPAMNVIYEYEPDNEARNIEAGSISFDNLIGRYELSIDAVMDVKKSENGLEMEIADFIYTDLYPESAGKMATDINGVYFLFDASGNNRDVTLDVRGRKVNFSQLPADYKLASEFMKEGKYDEAIEKYREVKRKVPDARSTEEANLNQLGYELIGEKKYDGALKIFKLNVEFYPEAFNAYDSLGEIYMIMGDSENAIVNYKKSIELNPRNDNGKKMLEKLEDSK